MNELEQRNLILYFIEIAERKGLIKNKYKEEKEKLNVKGDFDKGYYFYTKPNKTGVPHFFAASGCRNQNYGAVGVVYERGFHWPAIPSRKDYNYLLGFHSGLIYPCSEAERSYGFSVRSAEEKVLKCALEEVANDV